MTTLLRLPNNLAEKWQDSAFLITRTLGRFAAQLELKQLEIAPGCSLSYYDNNKVARETLVLVHGFNADKDHWISMAMYLSRYRVIIPDLGGHGQSWYDPTLTYDIPCYTHQLYQLVNALGLERFHLVGNSMGGWVAAYYAHQFPLDVSTLTLMNACGVSAPVLSPFFKALARHHNPFFYSSVEEYADLLQIAVANPASMPTSILAVNYRHAMMRMSRAKKMFADITNADQTFLAEAQMLDGLLPDIRQPTFILWGDCDGIMDMSMADVLHNGLPHSEMLILRNVGHTPMLEQPRKTARCVRDFIERNT